MPGVTVQTNLNKFSYKGTVALNQSKRRQAQTKLLLGIAGIWVIIVVTGDLDSGCGLLIAAGATGRSSEV